MGKHHVTLKNVVDQMTSGRGSTGLSFNELSHKLKKAAETGNPSQYDFTKVERPYNTVNTGGENYIPNNIQSGYNNNPVFSQSVADYLNGQMAIVRGFYSEKDKLDKMGYDPMTYDNLYNQLKNNTTQMHYNLLGQLRLYLQSLSFDELSQYQTIAVQKQLWLCSRLQYHLSSDKKKEYDYKIASLNRKIEEVKNSNMGINMSQVEQMISVLTAEREAVIHESNEYMNDCIRNNGGYQQQKYMGGGGMKEPFNNVVNFGNMANSPLYKSNFQTYPEVVAAGDSDYDELKRMNEPSTYTPYYGEKPYNMYNNKYNYLTNSSANRYNQFGNTNQNLSSYKNTFIEQMRKAGFVPDSFGVPDSEDYIMQLIWVTPVGDPNTYNNGFMSSPTWYLTPEQLGYKDYIEYNQAYLDSLKVENRPVVKIYKFNEMTPEEIAEVYKNKEIDERNRKIEEEKKKKELDKPHVIKLRRNSKVVEEEKVEKEENPLDSMTPDFTSDEYVLQLSQLEYVPEIVRHYLKLLSPAQLRTFSLEGLMYANKYKAYVNPYTFKFMDQTMKDMINQYEEMLVEKRGQEELETEIEKANKVATEMYNKLGGGDEEISIYDTDKFEEIKELARKKLEAVVEFDYNKLIPDEVKKQDLPKHMDELVDDDLEFNELQLNDPVEEELNIDDEVDKAFDEYVGYESIEDMLPYDPDDEDSLYAYLKAKREALANPTPNDYLDIPILDDGTTLEDAFDKLDMNKIENRVERLKNAIKANISARPFQGMTNVERLIYLREQINGGLYDEIDMTQFKPGIHKFYTSKGIFVLDNRDYSVQQAMPLESLSLAYQQQYLGIAPETAKASDVYMNEIVLPKIKPQDKKEFKNPTKSYDYNEYLTNLNILRKRDEIALGMWKLNNVHMLYNMNSTATSCCINMMNRLAEYSRLTGMNPSTDDMTYDEWAQKIIPYRKAMHNKGRATTKAIQIYDVVSNYNFSTYSEEANKRLDNAINYMGRSSVYDNINENPLPPVRRDYGTCDFNQDVFRERLKYNCRHTGKQKCYSTYTSGVVDMEKKTPPPQFTGVKNGLFL